MEDTILLHDNSEYLEQNDINQVYPKKKEKPACVYIVICIFLVLIVVQNMCIFMFLIKIQSFADHLDLRWLESDEMYVYKKKFETIIDAVCKLYIKC